MLPNTHPHTHNLYKASGNFKFSQSKLIYAILQDVFLAINLLKFTNHYYDLWKRSINENYILLKAVSVGKDRLYL